ncbi:UNVERIFIED_CONTAM: hypothetical protein Sindi_0071900, partial [Sesamum indicum]
MAQTTTIGLQNLKIVLNFKNQVYVFDKSLPTTLLKGSLLKECVTFERWHENNCKVRCTILALMINDFQKKYDRLEYIPSIMLHIKEVYATPDRHIRYAATKAFFAWRQNASLAEKLKDLKAGLDCVMYINVILHLLPPSCDPFIINYNMNGLEKSSHGLINMLVQYKATTHKFVPSVLIGETLISKAKGKKAGSWKRKKGKGKVVLATFSAPSTP